MKRSDRTARKQPPRGTAAARAKRARRREAEERRRRRRNVIVIVGMQLFFLAGLAYSMLAGGGSDDDGDTPADANTRTYDVTSRNHVAGDVSYPQTPPVGGDHSPIWQDCGYYPDPILPQLGVHSLEHGAVWVTYSPTLPAEGADQLRQLAERRSYVLVSRWFDELPGPVVASAWGRQLVLQSATDPALDAFVRRYAQDPGAPEPGAPCTGGQGR